MKEPTFMDKCVAGDIAPNEIGRYIEKWHNVTATAQTVFEFLGMTEDEYARWVEDPSSLTLIVGLRAIRANLLDKSRTMSSMAYLTTDPRTWSGR